MTAGAKLRQDIQAELDENGVELDSKEAALFEQFRAGPPPLLKAAE